MTAKQMKSTAAMQRLQSDKRYIEIQTKYKNDREKLAQEQMKLYQEMKINPMSSCLPTLIQFPIIIGLYQALIQTMATGPLDLLKLTNHIYPKSSIWQKYYPSTVNSCGWIWVFRSG